MEQTHIRYRITSSTSIRRVAIPFTLEEMEALPEEKEIQCNKIKITFSDFPENMELPKIEIEKDEGGERVKFECDFSNVDISGIKATI